MWALSSLSLSLCVLEQLHVFRNSLIFIFLHFFFPVKPIHIGCKFNSSAGGTWCNYHIRRLRTQAPHSISIAHVLNLSHGFWRKESSLQLLVQTEQQRQPVIFDLLFGQHVGWREVSFFQKSAVRTMSTFAVVHCVLGCGAEQQAAKMIGFFHLRT